MPRLLVHLKRALCRLHLAGVVGLVEFCGTCGRRVRDVWWAPDALWREVTGEQHGGGVRCIRCFDRECYARGKLLQWSPRVAHERGPDGQWRDVAPPAPQEAA